MPYCIHGSPMGDGGQLLRHGVADDETTDAPDDVLATGRYERHDGNNKPDCGNSGMQDFRVARIS